MGKANKVKFSVAIVLCDMEMQWTLKNPYEGRGQDE